MLQWIQDNQNLATLLFTGVVAVATVVYAGAHVATCRRDSADAARTDQSLAFPCSSSR